MANDAERSTRDAPIYFILGTSFGGGVVLGLAVVDKGNILLGIIVLVAALIAFVYALYRDEIR